MQKSEHDGHLGAVYEAKDAGEVAELYDGWAETYDAEMAAAGYRHPSICLALLARHLEKGTAPLLDAGAGTGLVGEWLGIMGYTEVEALDISAGMLAVARKKRAYTAYHQRVLGKVLPFSDNAYGGVISTGVFTSGHVGVEGLPELIRICRPGGVIALTIKNTLWEDGFEAFVDQLEADEKITKLEETAPYVSMPGEEGSLVPSRGLVLGVC